MHKQINSWIKTEHFELVTLISLCNVRGHLLHFDQASHECILAQEFSRIYMFVHFTVLHVTTPYA